MLMMPLAQACLVANPIHPSHTLSVQCVRDSRAIRVLHVHFGSRLLHAFLARSAVATPYTLSHTLSVQRVKDSRGTCVLHVHFGSGLLLQHACRARMISNFCCTHAATRSLFQPQYGRRDPGGSKSKKVVRGNFVLDRKTVPSTKSAGGQACRDQQWERTAVAWCM